MYEMLGSPLRHTAGGSGRRDALLGGGNVLRCAGGGCRGWPAAPGHPSIWLHPPFPTLLMAEVGAWHCATGGACRPAAGWRPERPASPHLTSVLAEPKSQSLRAWVLMLTSRFWGLMSLRGRRARACTCAWRGARLRMGRRAFFMAACQPSPATPCWSASPSLHPPLPSVPVAALPVAGRAAPRTCGTLRWSVCAPARAASGKCTA